jgi:hypothetical protein
MAEQVDAKLDALNLFEKWSNYLLVTTVAAAGWIASNGVTFASAALKSAALWSLGVSVIFGIFTLALVPLIAEQAKGGQSIYKVPVEFMLLGTRWTLYLTQACRPQHALFILGIIFYCIGTARFSWVGIVFGCLAIVYGVLSAPRRSLR